MTDASPASDRHASGSPDSDGERTHPRDAHPDEEGRSLQERYHDVEQQYEDVRDRLETYNHRAVDFIRDNPAVCIAGALGAGYLLGRLASKRWLT